MSTEIPRNESLTAQGEEVTFTILSSEDYGDVSLYDFLRKHIDACHWCGERENDPPPPFGTADVRHCPEYYEIVQEYSDYERDYISRADP